MEFFVRMQFILQKNCDQVGKIVRTELLYYKDTHKTEIGSTQELLKLNMITYDQQLLHLCTLSGKDVAGKYLSLPTNKDMARILSTSAPENRLSVDDQDEDYDAVHVGQ